MDKTGIHREPGTAEPTLTALAYARLSRDVLEGRLRPGTKLKVNHLAEQYALGGTPIREALLLLSSEGLVVSSQRTGFRVAEISIADLRDIALLRTTVEREALRLAIGRGGDVWEGEIASTLHQLGLAAARAAAEIIDMDAFELAHRRFHIALISACGSERMLALCGLYFDQASRYRRLLNTLLARGAEAFEREHRKLAGAVLARDADGAVALLERHLAMPVNRAEKMLASRPGDITSA
jgi:DNA-binding GntR family transcriptional regulator